MSEPDATPAAAVAQRAAVVATLYRRTAPGMVAVLANAAIVTVALWRVFPTTPLLIWLVLNILAIAGRYGLLLRFLKARRAKRLDAEAVQRWRVRFILLAALSSIVFGSAGLLFFAMSRIEYQVLLCFVMCSIVALSVTFYSIDRLAFFVYTAPLVVPVTTALFLSGRSFGIAVGFLTGFFYFLMALSSHRVHSVANHSVKLGIDISEISDVLESQKDHISLLEEAITQAHRTLEEYVLRDELTNLRNRRFVAEAVEEEVQNFGRQLALSKRGLDRRQGDPKHVYGLFVADLDNFKLVNTDHGQDAGDRVIQQVAEGLLGLVRNEDMVARWGGAEFLIVLRQTEREYLDTFAEKLRTGVMDLECKADKGQTVHVTCSVGYMGFPLSNEYPDAVDFQRSLALAEGCLRRAKAAGKNQALGVTLAESAKADYESLRDAANRFDDAVESGSLQLRSTADK